MGTITPNKSLGEEIARLEAQLQQDPASSDFHRLADAYTRTGRFLDAIRVARQGLKHHPQMWEGYVALGRSLFGSRNLPKAIKVLRQALTLESESAEPYRLLGEILLWQGAPSEALAILEEAVERGINERSVLALLQRAQSVMEDQKTGIISMPPEKGKGMGNVAIAGTIGRAEEAEELAPLPEEVTRRIAFPEEPRKPPPPAAGRAAAVRPAAPPTTSRAAPETAPGRLAPPAATRPAAPASSRAASAPTPSPRAAPVEVTPTTSEKTPIRSTGMKTLPDGVLEATPADPPPSAIAAIKEWPSIHDQWAKELDAHIVEPFPDLDSEPSAPLTRRVRVDVPLPQSKQPLVPDMPPVPPDVEEASSEVSLATVVDEQTAVADRRASGRASSREIPAAPPLARAASREIPAAPPLARAASREIPAAPPLARAAKDMAIEIEVEPPSKDDRDMTPSIDWGSGAQPLPDASVAPASTEQRTVTSAAFAPTLPIEAVSLPADDRRLLEALAPTGTTSMPDPMSAEIVLPEWRGDGGDPQSAADWTGTDDPQSAADWTGAADPQSAADWTGAVLEQSGVQPQRRRSLLPLFLLVLAAAVAATFLIWRNYFAGNASRAVLAQAADARLLDTAEAYRDAAKRLSSARGKARTGQLASEEDLMAALAWLHYRVGEPPPVQDPRGSWAEALAQATLALANLDAERSRSFLERVPNSGADRALRALLLGWAAWIEGKHAVAEKELQQAQQLFNLTAAHVLLGHLRREQGDSDGALRAYRAALAGSPRHELAAAGVVQLLLVREPSATEVDELLGRIGRTPTGQSWKRLLTAERAFRQGEQGAAISELQAAVSAAPTDRALLFHGVQVLTDAGQFEAARQLLTQPHRRFRRSEQDSAVFLLEVDLDIAQGLEARAISKLRARELSPRGRRSLALALILAGRPQEAQQALASDTSGEAKPLRLTTAALLDEKSSLDPLRELGATSHEAKLGLVLARIARRELSQARQAAQELAACPWHRYRALTLVAETQELEGDLGGALATLGAVVRPGGSPRFTVAQELLGRVQIRLGRYREAAQVLTAALREGRETASLALALARAQALAGKPAEAASTIEQAKRLGARGVQLRLARATIALADGKSEVSVVDDEADVTYLIAFGQARMQADDPAQAERAWKRALEAEPGNPLPYLRLGGLYAAQKKRAAVTYYTSAITRASKKLDLPRSIVVEARIGLARYQLASKQAAEATSQLRAALKIDPSSALALRLLGESYIAQRKLVDARAALQQSVRLAPEDAEAFFLLGTAAKCERKQVRQALKRFLELEPKGKRSTAAHRALQRLR